MYGLPAGFDASRLVGCSLELVSFSANTVSLSFTHEVSITILGRFTHSIYGEAKRDSMVQAPVRDSMLMQLVEHTVESARSDSDGTLRLRFSNGHVLTIFDDEPMYEAYHLKIGDEEIIV